MSNIVKMHGDLRHEEHIIITQRDYDSFMERYPVVATHLSAMLITRTPLFIGYSLSDPDFENIRRVVRARLGAFERMAYVVQFDVSSDLVENALEQKLHIISLDGTASNSRDNVLSRFFGQIQTQLDTKAGIGLRNSRPDLFEDIATDLVQTAVASSTQSALIETTSRLCFVMMPFGGKRSDELYRLSIATAARDNGLTALRADECDDRWIHHGANSECLFQQSRICVADLTGSNPNVMFEVGYAQAIAKPLVMIVAEGAQLPFDIAHQRVVQYGEDPCSPLATLSAGAIALALSDERLSEASRLLELGEYRAAIATTAVVLEHKFRQMLSGHIPGEPARTGLGQLVKLARRRRLIDAEVEESLMAAVKVRNSAVHEVIQPTRRDAQRVLTAVRRALDKVEDPGKS